MDMDMEVLQNSQNLRVCMEKSYNTHRSSARVYECCTRTRTRTPVFDEVSSTRYILVSILFSRYLSYKKVGYGCGMLYPYPRHCGTGVQNIQKFRIRV